MENPVGWFWKKVSGNAIWDATKLLWGAGAVAVTTAFRAIYGYAQGHPDIVPLAIGLSGILILVVGAVVVNQKHKGVQSSLAGGGSSPILSAIRLPASGALRANAVRYVTNMQGDQDIVLGVRPKKLLFEPGGIVTQEDLQKQIVVDSRPVILRRFTENGLAVDDRGAKVDLAFYVLESEGPFPKPQFGPSLKLEVVDAHGQVHST